MKKDKRQPHIKTTFEFMWPTSDDWSPNYPRNCVRFAVYAYHNPDNVGVIPSGMIRLCVGGTDDSQMEKDIRLPETQYEEKLTEIKLWIDKLPNPVTKEWLLNQGFVWA